MPSEAEIARKLAGIDILIVDDNAPMRTLIRGILRAVGVTRTREASDVQEALEELATRPTDLVLLDHAMPGLSGLDMVRALRADPGHPASRVRIVMITGYGDRHHVTAARDAGVDEFLVKPISTRSLLQRIEAALAKPRTFIEADSFQGPDRRRRALPPPNGERRAG